MIIDVLRLVGGPLLAAIIGGLIVHFAARRRDVDNEQRRQRVDYLVNAYRTLTQAAHRELSGERAATFEDALSDVVLFGNDDQIRLARETIKALADGGEARLDELLISFRKALRHELSLRDDGLQQVSVLRFKGTQQHHTPLTLRDAWEVSFAKTEMAIASATSSSDQRSNDESPGNTIPGPADLSGEVGALRKLARAAPGAGVVTAYGHVTAALRSLLEETGEEPKEYDAPALARAAADRGLVSDQLVETVKGLEVLKNVSRRGGAGTDLSVEQASDYIDLVAAALYVLHSRKPDRQDMHQRES